MEIDDALLPAEFLDSSWIPKSSPSFQGDSVSSSTTMANFQNSSLENGRIEGLFPYVEKEENVNEDYDPCFHQPEKKRRLSSDQVKLLEKSFEVENKLEPERKVQLAKDLGLQPRQIAIWFQNRRARYKNKQLEKDYDSLKASYDKLKVDFDSLSNENAKLKFEVESLKEQVLVDPEATKKQNSSPVSENVVNANSANSDVLDSDSPYCTDGNHISLFQPVDSSRVLEPDISDFSQDEEDDFCRILPPPCLPKIKIESFDDLNADTCNLGNSVDDQTFWFWS